MNLYEYAKSELERIEKSIEQDEINKCILDIIKVFESQGHSRSSAMYTILILNRLFHFYPLTPLTGEDDEWAEISNGVYQNCRCSSVFKDVKKYNGQAYNIDGRVFTEDDGKTWFTSENSITLITFPYYVSEPEKVYLSHNS